MSSTSPLAYDKTSSPCVVLAKRCQTTSRKLCLFAGVVISCSIIYYGLQQQSLAHVSLSNAFSNYVVKFNANLRSTSGLTTTESWIHPRNSPATLTKLQGPLALPFRDGKRWSNVDGEATINPFPLDVEFVVHNPDLCHIPPNNPPIDWLIYFHSKPDNVEKRQLLRTSWASHDLFNSSTVRRVFMVGLALGKKEQQQVFDALKDEHAQHGDLVVGNFLDSYNNLTLKSIMALKWISMHCANARQAVKADDDVFVNIVELTSLISRQSEQIRLITCPIFYKDTMPILRDPDKCMKWCAIPTDFPGDGVYPQYCSGTAYVLSVDIIGDLYRAALRTRFFFIDDVYTTGLLPLKLTYPVTYVNFDFDWDGDKTRADYALDNNKKAAIYAIMTSEPHHYNYYFNRSLHKLTVEQVESLSTAVQQNYGLR